MSSIQEQIEALTQELRPYPNGIFFILTASGEIAQFDFSGGATTDVVINSLKEIWINSPFASTNKAEVEEYADCYRRLKLYQLLGKKAEKEFPIDWNKKLTSKDICPSGTDFTSDENDSGLVGSDVKCCVLGGVWFAREEDRLEALKICGIDAEFQKKCAKFGLGGA